MNSIRRRQKKYRIKKQVLILGALFVIIILGIGTFFLLQFNKSIVKRGVKKTVPIYAMYNTVNSSHYYTQNLEKYIKLSASGDGWKKRGVSWLSPEPDKGDIPVYQMTNPKNSDVRWTTSKSEVDKAVSHSDWESNGVAFYAVEKSEKNSVPVYEVYNPNATAGKYYLTTDAREKNDLVKAGWKDKGIAWYELKYKPSTKLTIAENFPCPRVIEISNTFFMYGQGNMAWSSDNKNYTIRKDRTVVKDVGLASEADEAHRIKGQYVLYFGTLGENGRPNYLNTGTSNNPNGPFQPNTAPLVTLSDLGPSNGIIDPTILKDGQKRYLVYVQDIDGNNGIDIVELSKDGQSTVGQSSEILKRSKLKGIASRVESPSLVKAPDGTYVLFFSGNWGTNSNYFTGYATSKTINGVYKYGGEFLTQGNTKLDGPGEGSAYQAKGKNYFVFNAWEGPRDHNFRILPGGKGRYVYQAQFKWVDGHIPVLE